MQRRRRTKGPGNLPGSQKTSEPTLTEKVYGTALSPREINSIILAHAEYIVWMCTANKILPLEDLNEIKNLSGRIHSLIGTIK